jgi:hypothetical protein
MGIVMFLAELKNLELCASDIMNMYLEVHNEEQIGFIAGHEFGPLEVHALLKIKVLYGVWIYGAHYHDNFFNKVNE